MWSVAWAAIFALLGVIIGVVNPDSIDPGEEPLRIAWIGGVLGFISGTGRARPPKRRSGREHKVLEVLEVLRVLEGNRSSLEHLEHLDSLALVRE